MNEDLLMCQLQAMEDFGLSKPVRSTFMRLFKRANPAEQELVLAAVDIFDPSTAFEVLKECMKPSIIPRHMKCSLKDRVSDAIIRDPSKKGWGCR
jgi:hypothetical protein